MVCIYCDTKTEVTNSRLQKRLNRVWRRRQCLACKTIYSTIECMDLGKTLLVTRSGKHFKPFSRDKLLISLHNSLLHRKSSLDDAIGLRDTIESNIVASVSNGKIDSQDIALICHEILARFDHLAANHYHAFHPTKLG